MPLEENILIVGAGLAGLSCARKLQENGIAFTIYESSDAVGGRLRTDRVDGFLFDRGFQIFLTAYPEAKRCLDYSKLHLRSFYPAAMVFRQGKFQKLSDPFRQPLEAVNTLFSSIGSLSDKIKVALLRQSFIGNNNLQIPASGSESDASTLLALQSWGFSEQMIQGFFRPFFSGIFLEPNLETSSGLFKFVFEMLSRGENTLPAGGMQAIPEQLAACLPESSIKLKQPVRSIEGNHLILEGGESVSAPAIVIACEEPQCRKLLAQEFKSSFRSQTCVYYAAEKAPFDEPILLLNGDCAGPVMNFVVPSNVSATYAPAGKSLLSAVLLGENDVSDSALDKTVREQMRSWFGPSVNKWEFLRSYRIKYALPDQTPKALSLRQRSYKAANNIYCCGDYKETGSINGAMVSGRKAAEALIGDLLN